jgi:endonuclease IV
MAVLTFNVSVAGDKSFLSTYNHPMQIMPQQRKTITEQMLLQYPIIKDKRIACVHTSYVTRVFGEKILSPGFQRINILNYIALADRIGFPYVLVHGPESMKEWRLLDASLNILRELEEKSKKNVKIIIEMPAFKGAFIDELKERMASDNSYKKSTVNDITVLDYLTYYFEHITAYNFDIVLDTAHLYANGAAVEDMIALYKHFAKNMKITHLNGNKNRQFTSDNHCPIFMDKNKIEGIERLMTYLSTTNLVLVTENASDGVEYVEWKRFADKYKITIVPEHPNLNC